VIVTTTERGSEESSIAGLVRTTDAETRVSERETRYDERSREKLI
jgi:hypothetical protein